jgi:diphthine-ammonia ligase
MKFVALLSGGKDSCFNIMKCLENNHELVCLANLMPPDSETEEMNSFMYQSAAHNVIPLMAECFGVPLFRQEIHRHAKVQSLDYQEDEEDEVEDLFLLLQRVIQQYPDVKGIDFLCITCLILISLTACLSSILL